MRDKFNISIEKHKEISDEKKRRFRITGYFRLIVFSLAALSVYFYFAQNSSLLLLFSAAAGFAAFTALCIFHSRLRSQIDHAEGIIKINKSHLDRIDGQWTSFSDTGEEFSDPSHAYDSDLNITGKKSFFQFLNITQTWHGRHSFASDLLSASYNTEQIKSRQQAVSELSKDTEFICDMQYIFSQTGNETELEKLIASLKDTAPFSESRVPKTAGAVLQVFTFAAAAAALISGAEFLKAAAVCSAAVQAVVWGAGTAKTQKYLKKAPGAAFGLSSYSSAMKAAEDAPFRSEKLCEISRKLKSEHFAASSAVKELSTISSMINARHNFLFYFVLNVLFLWDYRCVFRLEKWKKKYASVSESWFEALGEFESLLSFSVLPNICEGTCIPEITDEFNTVKFEAAGHPMLKNEIRVANDFTCENNIFIISGSNMSGKTTFIRTVGINLVLANAGGFACAEKMTCSPVRITASIGVPDDLNEGISSFYAELKKIKNIIKTAEENPNTMFLIDEIFRGTNSADRHTGARAVIAKLCSLNAAGLITTHDLELCSLEEYHQRIGNFSFSEYYEGNKILFDYKIRPGRSQTTNAVFLMKMTGII